MKNFVLTALTCVFALNLTFAQDNEIKLRQISNDNKATIDQTAKNDQVDVLQTGGNRNVATIKQVPGRVRGYMSTNQDFYLEQNGSDNRLTAASAGIDNDVKAFQIGNENRATFDIRNNQKDQGARAELYQQGRDNVATIKMVGRRNYLDADQIGRDNYITLRMEGGSAAHRAELRQEGDHNRMDVDQFSSSHDVNAQQLGNYNRMDVQQLGSSHDVSALQIGNHNVAILKQSNK